MKNNFAGAISNQYASWQTYLKLIRQ